MFLLGLCVVVCGLRLVRKKAKAKAVPFTYRPSVMGAERYRVVVDRTHSHCAAVCDLAPRIRSVSSSRQRLAEIGPSVTSNASRRGAGPVGRRRRRML